MNIQSFNFQVCDFIPENEYYHPSPSIGPLRDLLFNIKSNKQANSLEGWHNIDDSYVRGSILSEIHNHIKDLIRKNLVECEVIDYLYCDLDNQLHIDILFDKLNIHSPKFVRIPSGALSNSIQDSKRFNFLRGANHIYNSVPYTIGNANGIKFEVDPYFKFDDDVIYLFDGISINIQNIEFYEGWDIYHFVDKCKFKFGFKIDNPRAIAIITDNQSRHWKHWVKLNRDHKLNKIIDGKS